MTLILLLLIPFCAGLLCLATLSKMNLGTPRHDNPPLAAECPWKISAMALVAVAVIALGFWLPVPLYELVQQTARILGGTP
jgi:formate hydrogenlyase subunit 3/multisubunit Na+/H+ antiporter MnhD subunit